jgi:ABC-type arginine/histidine transport system permease subunit
VPLRVVAGSWSVVHQTFVDFGIITWALVLSAVRREVVRGSFRAHPFDAGGDDQRSTGMRAWTHWAGNISPNAIAIDIDKERNLSLVHDLIRNRNSEKPA